MSLKLNSSGGGSVTLQEPNTASTLTIGLPAVNGTVITTADSGTVTPTMLARPLTLATAQNTTSGTSIDFTGIPSWARRVTVMFDIVSTNGTSTLQLQLGSGSIKTSGYVGVSTTIVNNTLSTVNIGTGIPIGNGGAAADLRSGSVVFTNHSGFVWTAAGIVGFQNGAFIAHCAGSTALSGSLDRIRLTTVNGTDTFDAGSVNIMYEG